MISLTFAHQMPSRRKMLIAVLGAASLVALAPTVIAQAQPVVVAIDIGHTPSQPGATSARGVSEFVFNKALAEQVVLALAQYPNVKPVVINEPGFDLGLKARTDKARRIRAKLFVSLHHDSVQEQFLSVGRFEGKDYRYSRKTSGYSLFVSSRNSEYDESTRLAEAVGHRLRGAGFRRSLYHSMDIEGERRPVVDSSLGIFRYDGLAVLRTAGMPAILFEAGFIVNPEEEAQLADASRQSRMAAAVAEGIAGYAGRVATN